MDGLSTLRALDLTSLQRLSLPYYVMDTLTTLRAQDLTSLDGLDYTALDALSTLQSLVLSGSALDYNTATTLTSLTEQRSTLTTNALSVLRGMDLTVLEKLSVPYYTMDALTNLRGMNITSLDSLDPAMRESLTALRSMDLTRHGLDWSTSTSLTSLGSL